jgi:hypothetical protein
MIAVFYSSKNTPGINPKTGKPWADATGAFAPESKAFCKTYGIPPENRIGIDCRVSAPRRKRAFLDGIKSLCDPFDPRSSIEVVVCFCHGWYSGIQFGITREGAGAFLTEAKPFLDLSVTWIFYACSTAENDLPDSNVENIGPGTDGGFADRFRDKMVELDIGGRVYAHKKAGHTTENPTVIVFPADPVEGYLDLVGGFWLVAPGSDHWAAWVKKLSAKRGDLRFRFPLMSQAALFEELDQ